MSAKITIPSHILAEVAEVLSNYYTGTDLRSQVLKSRYGADQFFGSSKKAKIINWLECMNDESSNPYEVLGRLIRDYMDEDSSNSYANKAQIQNRDKIHDLLREEGFDYYKGGNIGIADEYSTIGSAGPKPTLEDHLRTMDVPRIEEEFARAEDRLHEDPKAALSAASNILEAVCKTYIEQNNLPMPNNSSLDFVWKDMSEHLGLKTGNHLSKDTNQVIQGLLSVVKGVGALRTHAGASHNTNVDVTLRHARLALHAAYSVTWYVLETWDANGH